MNYMFKIISAKGVPLDYLYQELELIISKHKGEGETKIKRIPASDCILLTSNNLKLRSALIKDEDFKLITFE